MGRGDQGGTADRVQAGDDAQRQTTAEKLQLHNLLLLVQSARTKQASKRRLSKPEIAAVAELERRQARAIDLPYWRAIPKGDFLALFGGSSKVYIDWARRHGFPWGNRATVDAVAILAWLRGAFAGERQQKQGRDVAEVNLELKELELAERKGSLVHVADIQHLLQQAAGVLRGSLEAIAEIDPELAGQIGDRLQRLSRELTTAVGNDGSTP